MTIGDFIRMGNAPPALRFMVIGGWAVGAHGHTRSTFDVDFLVPCEDRGQWFKKTSDQGLTKSAEQNTFAQFGQKDGDGLDLMFVSSSTFEKMWANSEERQFEGVQARTVSLDHLLALKLHAINQQLPHRTSKDCDDVEVLVRRHQLDLKQPKYEQLFLKYATREIYETFLRIIQL